MLLILALVLLCGFSSAGSFPKPLTVEEEKDNLWMLQNGSAEEKEKAKQNLILHNLRLVAHIAKKYSSYYKEQEELISIGIIGLIKAILSYNTEKSIRLATYASRCIENEMLMSMRNAKKFQNDISLYEPIGTDRDGNEIVMLDVVNGDTSDFAEQMHFHMQTEKALQGIMDQLTLRERIVIIHRYGLFQQEPKTQQEIAANLGISRSYVSRIEKKALKKLNTFLQE